MGDLRIILNLSTTCRASEVGEAARFPNSWNTTCMQYITSLSCCRASMGHMLTHIPHHPGSSNMEWFTTSQPGLAHDRGWQSSPDINIMSTYWKVCDVFRLECRVTVSVGPRCGPLVAWLLSRLCDVVIKGMRDWVITCELFLEVDTWFPASLSWQVAQYWLDHNNRQCKQFWKLTCKFFNLALLVV